ncbi:Transcriptional regulatory protein ZraR [Symmachiella dynata]|uniref:sigma 54-interacting transcriptional regulator n=1 Tax=Symmachiella dynata TaxID=2527995 RepID=UPI00118C1236|nr:sigma 54-interacting transcriptional regulator [Symmachiella dynata]QDT46648.1 Transcriptional regulatory protein ZraR [Symmachiella dynata]
MKRRHTTTGNLTRLLGGGSTPLFVMNGQRKLLVFNRGCEELTGFTAEDVVGRISHYGSSGETPVEELTAGLCPPPEVLAGEQRSTPAYLTTATGASLPRMLNFYPFCDEEGQVIHVLGIVSAIPQPPPVADPTAAQTVHAELAALRGNLRQRFGQQTLVCKGPATTRMLNQIELAQHCQAAVFLQGEPGTGKQHLARVIHYGGDAKNTAFVAVDCRKLAASEIDRTVTRLLEAATDPAARGLGISAGSLFLGHVEHLPRDVQRRIVKAHDGEEPPALRLFSSSCFPLAEAVEREDLLFELQALLTTVTIEVPPLRDRPEDLLLLAQHFLEDINRRGEKQVGGFARDVVKLYTEYNWPGNLEELFKVVGETHAAATGEMVLPADLPFRFRTGFDAQHLPPVEQFTSIPLEQLTSEYETELIQRALRQCKQNKSQAADLLQINRAKLYRRMEVLGIDDADPGEEE